MNSFNRRRFLAVGAAVPALLVTACSNDPEAGPTAVPGRDDVPEPDLDALEFSAGLEIVAEAAYRDALSELAAGRLGQVPAAGSELLQAAATQHGQGLAAIRALLGPAGRRSEPDANIEFEASVVTPALTAAKSWPEVASVLRTVEAALSATYLVAIHSTLQSAAALRLAAGIQATGAKRVATFNFLMGEYPVPDTFQKTDSAVRR